MLHRKMKETAPTKKLNDINSCNYKKKGDRIIPYYKYI